MARRRYQATGHLYIHKTKQGDWWRLQYWDDAISPDGRIRRRRFDQSIGPASGPGRMTEKQAKAYIQQHILPRVNAASHKPQAIMSLNDFIVQKFRPEFIRTKRRSTQLAYETRLENHILPRLGTTPLRELGPADISEAVYGVMDEGLSTQTATHIRNILSAVFEHARRVGCYFGDNPARLVKPPEMVRKETYAYSWEQAKEVLGEFKGLIHAAVWLALTTGLRVGELRGLRWMRVNLSHDWVVLGGESLAPLSLAVREQYGIGGFSSASQKQGYGPLKRSGNRRNIPLDAVTGSILGILREGTKFNGPEHPVFASSRGTPMDSHNISNREFKRAAKKLGYPVAWHVFRHTYATLMDQVGDVPMSVRRAGLGHSSARMTLHYTHGRMEDQRKVVEEIGKRLLKVRAVGGVQ